MGKSFVTIKYKINSTARITIEVSEKVKEVIEQTDRTVHISYDLVGILPELNNPLHEEMALLLLRHTSLKYCFTEDCQKSVFYNIYF